MNEQFPKKVFKVSNIFNSRLFMQIIFNLKIAALEVPVTNISSTRQVKLNNYLDYSIQISNYHEKIAEYHNFEVLVKILDSINEKLV